MNPAHDAMNLDTSARVIHWAFWYDWMLKLITLGREGRFREKLLDLAGIAPGEIVLDAGCGPGTMAIAARRRVGPTGEVYGIDASPEMVERARAKASRAGLDISFQRALLEELPFPDSKFDLVTTSLVLHHFPADVLPRCLAEIRRVLKPDGRLVAVDFAGSGHGHRLPLRRNHPHHTFDLNALTPILNEAGMVVRERGSAGFLGTAYIKATRGAAA